MSSFITGLKSLFGLGNQSSNTHKKITASEAQDMMKNQKLTILDVRSQEEYAGGHIPKAVILPSGEIATRAEQVLPNKDAVILVYCLSGGRSGGAAKHLASMGYTNIYDFGGLMNWKGKVVK